MVRTVAAVLILSLFTMLGTLAAQPAAAPEALMQYVRDARKAGLKDSQIEREATKAGWGADAVKTALGQPGGDSARAASAPAGTAKPPETPAAAGAVKPPADVGTDATRTGPSATVKPPGDAGAGGTRPAPAPSGSAKPPADSGVAPAAAVGPPLTVAAPEAPAKERGAPDDYEIGAGDVLHISVWKEPDVSVQSAVVRPDGKISMPLLKEIPVQGLTVIQAERLITDELAKFVTAPDVTVVVAAINSKKIYVTGAVKKEGPIAFSYRMTVLQALSEAGGLTDYAKRRKIYVLHNEGGRQFTFPFDYDAVLKGQHMELNINLTPGDTVVVPH